MKIKHPIVVILSPGFPKDESDTSCLPTQQLFVQILSDQFADLRVKIITFQYPYHNQQYQWKSADVFALNGRNRNGITRMITWIKAWRQLSIISKRFDVKAIISFWCGECALVGNWFSKTHSLRHLCWISGQDAKKENKYVQWIRPSAYELVAMSDFLQRNFFKHHNIKPAHVIPPGIEGNMFCNDAIEKDIDIIGVGSLIPLKRYQLFIEIIAELKKILPNIKAVICGEGEQRNQLQAAIDNLALNENIQLIGEQKHDVVLQLMKRSKVLLHTSMYEGFGVVCLEALAAGAYVIGFTKPMDEPICNWRQVDTKQEMVDEALSLLVAAPCAEPSLLYLMKDSVQKMMQLVSIRKEVPHEHFEQWH